MPSFARAFISRTLLLACILAIAVTCGLPSAIHQLGHDLTSTNCEASLGSSTPSLETAGFSVDEKLTECWIQTLVSSVSQHAYRVSTLPAVSLVLSSPLDLSVAATPVILVFHPRDWTAPRGPPIA